MITASPRELVSLLLFAAVILGIYGTEAFLWGRYALARARRRSPGKALSARRAMVLHGLAAAGIVCVLYGYTIEPYWIEVNTATIRTSKLADATFRIVQISDLHCDVTPRNEEKAVEIVNRLQPDVIVATGDYINHASAVPRLREMLSRLEAPLGKFAVEGNFEVHRRLGAGLFEGTGFRLLRGDSAVLANGTDALGIFGLGFARSNTWDERIEEFPEDRFDVFLFHTPDLIEEVHDRGVDLYLCGHTHGGQVALPWYGALITFSKFGKKYEAGRYQVGDTTLYVNRGLGMEPRPAPQVRFCARPEISVFDIQPDR